MDKNLVYRRSAALRSNDYDKARQAFLPLLEYREGLKQAGLLDYVIRSLEFTWIMREEYDDEIGFFSEYLDRHPEDLAAFVARASAFWYTGEFEKAFRDYSHVLRIQPADILARSGRGQVLAEMGKSENALDDLDLALRTLQARQTPSEWDEFYKHVEAFVYRGRGVALAGLKKYELAMHEFNSSITLSPENAWVYFSRAEMNDILGHRQEAIADYDAALAKKTPPLTGRQRERAAWRIRELADRA